MTNRTFITILSALSATAGSATAGWVLLPIHDDVVKAVGGFVIGLVATFLSGLLKPPSGPQVGEKYTRGARR